MSKTKMPEEVYSKVRQKAEYFHHVFNTPEGKQVLAALEEEFEGRPLAVCDNPNLTFHRLGGRDLLVFIKQMVATYEVLND